MWCQYIHSSAATPPQWLSTVLPLTHGLQAMHCSPMTHGIRRSLFWCCRRCFVWYAMQSLPTWCFEFRSVQLCERQPLICMDALTRKRTRWAWDEPLSFGYPNFEVCFISFGFFFIPVRISAYQILFHAFCSFSISYHFISSPYGTGLEYFLPFHVTPPLDFYSRRICQKWYNMHCTYIT